MVLSRLPLRWRQEARDLIELVLVPGLAMVLPWRWCFAIFRHLSRRQWLYREAAQVTFEQAKLRGWATDAADWGRKWRLVSMVDQADFYLSRFRSDRWMRRHMGVDGEWPDSAEPGILCTFHWGAGMWALRHMAASGMHAHALVAPLKRESMPGRRIRYEYYRARNVEVRAALGTEPLDISGSLRPVLQALRAGEQVAAAVDVPPQMVSSSQPVPFLGKTAKFPRGLLRVAAERNVPVTIFINGLDFDTGRRFLLIRQIGIETDLDALMSRVFGYLDQMIRKEPAAWHFWGMASHFLDSDSSGVKPAS